MNISPPIDLSSLVSLPIRVRNEILLKLDYELIMEYCNKYNSKYCEEDNSLWRNKLVYDYNFWDDVDNSSYKSKYEEIYVEDLIKAINQETNSSTREYLEEKLQRIYSYSHPDTKL